jgi:hypothetical protein
MMDVHARQSIGRESGVQLTDLRMNCCLAAESLGPECFPASTYHVKVLVNRDGLNKCQPRARIIRQIYHL